MRVLVLIADIVGSRSIPDRAAYQRRLGELLDSINERSREGLLSPYTITVGDEFQAVYRDTRSLFGDVMRIVSFSHPNRVRFALAYGPLSTELNPRAALGMDGPVFSCARGLLTSLKRQDRTIIQFDFPRNDRVELINACLALFANEMERWRGNAVAVFTMLLEGLTPRQVSEETGVHFTTVYRHMRGKHFEDLKRVLELLSRELDREIRARGAR
jgi:hypothetical protein